MRQEEHCDPRRIAGCGEKCELGEAAGGRDYHVSAIRQRASAIDAIAAELQRVADECVEVLWERSSDEQYGHAKAAVMLDIEAIEARFPKENV